MKKEQFTLNPDVVNIIDDLNHYFKDKKMIISDVIDDKSHQYIDLVQEGGGVLGISLLGFTYVLEQMGVRFLNIGGTSAGAINSLLLAAIAKPEEEKTSKILELLANKDLTDFIDGDEDAEDFIKNFMTEKIKFFRFLWTGIQVLDNFKKDLGLNPGKNFHEWLKQVIDKYGIYDTLGLEKRMNDLPASIRVRAERKDLIKNKAFKIGAKLAIIAAEVNTETKVEFPRMRELFYKNIDKVNPADYVRASMSIPLFFKPFELADLPNEGLESIRKWKRVADHHGGVPEKAIFVDGGVMSNFPIDVFHRIGIPSRPTIGVKLGLERKSNKNIQGIGDLIYGCFNAARNLRDFEFIHKNPDYKNLVSFIDTSEYNWLDFDVSEQMKIDLFIEGAKSAKQFLQTFNWKKYKDTRQILTYSVYNQEDIDHITSSLKTIYVARKAKVAFTESDQNDLNTELENLKIRISSLNKKVDGELLWIDDKPELLTHIKKALSQIGLNSTIVSSTVEAEEKLKKETFDFVISDVNRAKDEQSGIDFITWMSNEYPSYRKKVIYYIKDLDLSRGVPPYAFGITDSPVELFHLILDLSYRRY